MPVKHIEDALADALTKGAAVRARTGRTVYLRDVVYAYPQFARLVPKADGPAGEAHAAITFPYDPDSVRLIKSCKGARFDRPTKVWFVPASSAERLGEVLYILASRSRR